MSTPQISLYDRAYNPVIQAGLVFGAVLVFTIVGKIVNAIGLIEVSNRFPWMTAASFLLLFAVFNSVISLAVDDTMKYWGRSVYSFMGLAAASGGSAYLFSSLTIGEAGSYRWIFLVVTLGYLVFLGMMAFLKRIVEFAQKEEWNHPRQRNRNKR